MYRDLFGFIPEKLDFTFDGGGIKTICDPSEAVSWLKKYSNPEGFIYPPVVRSKNRGSDSNSDSREYCEYPEILQRLPATHEIQLTNIEQNEEIRNSESGFIIHCLGFLFGWRCQFADWWFEGPVNSKKQNDYNIMPSSLGGFCLDKALQKWRSWPQRERIVCTNALFLHNRTQVYVWDWERFQAECQVLDAFFKIANRQYGVPGGGHAIRIKKLCEYFDLYIDPTLVDEIVKLRNVLVHEALWGGQMPCSAPQGTFHMPIWLHKFNQRLGLAILGIENEYIRTSWKSLSQCYFDITP